MSSIKKIIKFSLSIMCNVHLRIDLHVSVFVVIWLIKSKLYSNYPFNVWEILLFIGICGLTSIDKCVQVLYSQKIVFILFAPSMCDYLYWVRMNLPIRNFNWILTCWRLVLSILGLGSMGNVCYCKNKSSLTLIVPGDFWSVNFCWKVKYIPSFYCSISLQQH